MTNCTHDVRKTTHTHTHTHTRKQQTARPHYTDGSVTKDQSGRAFTVKQGATTILEDSAAYTVPASSLIMEVEAVTHAVRWIALRGDSQTTHTILLAYSVNVLQKMKNGMGKPRLECVNSRHPTSKTPVGVLPWACQKEEK